MKKINLLLALCLSSCFGFAQIIYTVAGNGTPGLTGNGGFAASAELHYPQCTAIDGSGNIYVADWTNNVIRKISTTGIITTVAGNGTAGHSGDGGAATSAELDGPAGIAIDGSGNIYIADFLNSEIRKFTVGGNISTVAGQITAGYSGDGGAATSARLSGPSGVAVYTSGGSTYVFIADSYNEVIREFTVGGNISTVAGSGAGGYSGDGAAATSAKLDNPFDVAIDGTPGNVYIADCWNNVIRKFTVGGNISTVAGNGTGSGGMSYNTGGYTGDAGAATSAELNSPMGVSINGSNIIIADSYNNVIRSFTVGGNISTVVGSTPGTAGFSGDGGLATSAELDNPGHFAIDGSGNYYIPDVINNRIREVSTTCPANAGPNVTDKESTCLTWPGVKIGTPSVPNMTYAWTPNPAYLSSYTIAQPTSTWQTVGTPEVYTVTVSNSNCTSATSNVTVTAQSTTCLCCRFTDSTTEASSISLPVSFSVYPNPSNGNVTIGLNDNAEYLRIIDMQGKVVYETKNISAGEFQVDISKYTKGIYIVTVKMGDAMEKQKLIVE